MHQTKILFVLENRKKNVQITTIIRILFIEEMKMITLPLF